MIDQIHLKNITSYDGTGVCIKSIKKLNYFFGRNGSGKSSLGKYLYNLSLNSSISNDYSACSQIGYDSGRHKILVFNDEFIERNFILKRTQTGVFSLNEKK